MKKKLLKSLQKKRLKKLLMRRSLTSSLLSSLSTGGRPQMFTPEQHASIRKEAHKAGVPLEAAYRQAKDIKMHPEVYAPKNQAKYFKQQAEQKKRKEQETIDARLEHEDMEAFKKRGKGMDKVHPKFTVV